MGAERTRAAGARRAEVGAERTRTTGGPRGEMGAERTRTAGAQGRERGAERLRDGGAAATAQQRGDMARELWQYSKRQAASGASAGDRLPPLPLSPDAVALSRRLGLILIGEAPCHGYVNACTCGRCRDRQDRLAALTLVGHGPARAALLAKRDSADAIARRTV